MERRENLDKNPSYEFRFSEREKWIGRMDKRTFDPKELVSLYFQVTGEATEWHEDHFNRLKDDHEEELWNRDMAELGALAIEIENAIIEQELPTDEQATSFLENDQTGSRPSDEAYDAFLAYLQEENSKSKE